MPTNTTYKGFVKDFYGNKLLPITRGELVLDSQGQVALFSDLFVAQAPTTAADGTIIPGHAGLITAAEKAMLTGGQGGQSLSDVYSKLDTISKTIIKVRSIENNREIDSEVPFYTLENNVLSNLNVVLKESDNISLSNNNGVITFDLKDIQITDSEDTSRIKDIAVDSKGRVIEITRSAITNDEIPTTLSSKELDACVVSSIASELNGQGQQVYLDTAVVPKSYIDAAVDELQKSIEDATGIATGALVFKGTVSDESDVVEALNTPNTYYKVIGTFRISTRYLIESDQTNVPSDGLLVSTGDTIIIYNNGSSNKVVYIPSANDITAITVKRNGVTYIDNAVGNVNFTFSNIFNLSQSGNSTSSVTIDMLAAGSKVDEVIQGGYLTASDWIRFNDYSAKSFSYTSLITEGAGVYQLGTFTYGESTVDILGLNSQYSLSVEKSSVNDNYDPILRFAEVGLQNPTDIKFIGESGITVTKSDNNIKFENALSIGDDSSDYLNIDDDWKLNVSIGSVSQQFTEDESGLVDVGLLLSTISNYTTTFETIENSLNTTDEKLMYRYGSENLRSAVSCLI